MSGVQINKQKTEWGQFGIRKMAKTLLNKRELRTPPTYFNILKDFFFPCYLAWPFTTSLNRNITIWWGYFRLLAPTCTGMAAGAVCLKKPHHIVILQFSEVVKGHANWLDFEHAKGGNWKEISLWSLEFNYHTYYSVNEKIAITSQPVHCSHIQVIAILFLVHRSFYYLLSW